MTPPVLEITASNHAPAVSVENIVGFHAGETHIHGTVGCEIVGTPAAVFVLPGKERQVMHVHIRAVRKEQEAVVGAAQVVGCDHVVDVGDFHIGAFAPLNIAVKIDLLSTAAAVGRLAAAPRRVGDKRGVAYIAPLHGDGD